MPRIYKNQLLSYLWKKVGGLMITQQDVHNHIVLNANDWQKRYLSMQCGNDVEKLKEVEKSMANMVNGVVKALRNSGVDYLNKIV